jgi:tetratricopeptide (TPR) repeat protein
MVAQRGAALFELGRIDEAFAAAERGRELGAEDDIATQQHWRRVEAKVLASRGEGERAEALMREAIELVDTTDTLDMQGDTRFDLATVLELSGKRGEAVDALEQAAGYYERKENLLMLGRARERLEALARA